MKLPIYVVDAFTVEGKPFTGNAAGVCLLEYDDDITDDQKQQIAMEMNLSETAFVSFGWTKGNKLPPGSSPDIEVRTLRWLTPTNEVPLCGHATVASAKVIHEIQLKGVAKTISFESKFSGKLGAKIDESGSIILDFPSNPTHAINRNSKDHPWLETMLEKIVGLNKDSIIQDVQYSPGTKILLVRLKDEQGPEGLRKVKPNYQAMLEIDTANFVRDVIVTVKGPASGRDFYSRFFAPWDGIDEDPVTGLAHTVLTPYWTQELGKQGELKARQHSIRGGDLDCILKGERVSMGGQAKLVIRGELTM